jgi:hypothetical protein
VLALIKNLLAARRQAVADGELRFMWPGAARDVVTLVWRRGIVYPLHDLIWPPRTCGQLFPDCPLCNPQGVEK